MSELCAFDDEALANEFAEYVEEPPNRPATVARQRSRLELFDQVLKLATCLGFIMPSKDFSSLRAMAWPSDPVALLKLSAVLTAAAI